MKCWQILVLAVFGSICIGCGRADNNGARPQTAPETRPTPADFVRTANQTIIRSSGWQLPVSLPAEKKYHATTVLIEGKLIKVLNFPYFPTEKLLMKFPKFGEGGEVEYKVSQIIEFTDRRKKPYCYQFFAEDDLPTYSGATTYLSYRDDDGDGVFETLGESCTVPAWVK